MGILAIGDKNAIQRMILTLTFGIVSRPKVSVGIRRPELRSIKNKERRSIKAQLWDAAFELDD